MPTSISPHILVVDDDPAVRRSIRRVLENGGFAVREAANGAEALSIAAAAGGTIGLVLLDVSMPGLSARAVIQELGRSQPRIPVVLMTGHGEQEIEPALRQAAATFLGKPFEARELVRTVRDLLGSAA